MVYDCRDSGDVENQSIASNGLKSDANVSPADGCSSRVPILSILFSLFMLLLIAFHGSIKGKQRIPQTYLAIIQLLMILQMMVCFML